MNEQEKDTMRDHCIEQGYVPKDCYLLGTIVFCLVQLGEDPCEGCNLDRMKCKGRPNGRQK
jgi:hypothetical protein